MTTLITGTNRGIGASMVEAFRASGETVIATSRDGSTGAQLDVTDPASVTALAASLDGAPLDTLICNAGVYLDKAQETVTGYPAPMWADTFAANVTGVFLTVQALLPNLKAAPAPKIAIISSQMGSSLNARGNGLIYRASKAAAVNLGRNLSVDLSPDDIAVGIYHPGWVQTDMGGSEAAITVEESAAGLHARITALSMSTTGCFENWDGSAQDF